MFTPNSSAPPEATSPGRMVSICHSRSPASATTPGHHRQDGQAAAQRDRAPDRRPVDAQHHRRSPSTASGAPGSGRTPGAAPRASDAAAPTGPAGPRRRRRRHRSPARTSRPSAHATQRPACGSRSRTSSCVVGLWSSTGPASRSRRGHQRQRRSRTDQDAEDRDAVPAAAYALGEPADDLGERGGGQRSRAGRGARRPTAAWARGRTTSAPSSIQACMIQAMFSGASSSAPRWSVVVETGKATAWSRGHHLAAAGGGDRREDREEQEAQARRGQQREELAAALAREVAAEVRRGERSPSTVRTSDEQRRRRAADDVPAVVSPRTPEGQQRREVPPAGRAAQSRRAR